jgi:acyl-CoA thioesterase-1
VIAFLRASFRWTASAVLACLACTVLGAGSASATAAGVPTILVMGDSISASYGLAQGQGWVDLLQKRLASEGFPHRVVNASISGDTTAGGRTRIGPALKMHRPDIVIVELGGNDGLRGTALAPVRANLEFIVDAIQKAGAQALIVGMQVPPNYGASYVRQFTALFSDVAKARNAGYVPFLLQGFAEKPELFQPDRIHPTAQAQPLMLDTIWPELAKLVRRP